MQLHSRAAVRNQAGFTLLELVIVVIIIGILAAVAVPKFFDLAGKAEENALKATAANLGSAVVLNYGACKIGATGCVTGVTTCTAVANLTVPPTTGYTLTDVGSPPTSCTVTKTGVAGSASFAFPQ